MRPGSASHVTAVRVPTFFGSAMSVGVEIRVAARRRGGGGAAARRAGRVPARHRGRRLPDPSTRSSGSEATHVGRLRDDPSAEHALSLWITLDSIRKGAALNAVQIAELLVRDYL